MMLRAEPAAALTGRAIPPGDKSISHRSLMFGALASGMTTIDGLLDGDDVMATARALRALGATIEREAGGRWIVHGVGVGKLREATEVLDLGNSGTGARLLLGILAGCPFASFVSGDASLRGRPMGRVTGPLRSMGARFVARSGDRLPLVVEGGGLRSMIHESKVASAQVKSAILIAGLHADGTTTVVEPAPTRDHTERLLRHMGVAIDVEDGADGRHTVSVTGPAELIPAAITVPADPSSAAFPAVAALIQPGSQVRLEGIGTNPLRTGLYTTLAEMGGDLRRVNERDEGGEPIADLDITGGMLRGIEVPPERAPSMIDEYPILAVAAARASGSTVMRGIGELRVKETDRLAVMADGLQACGVDIEAGEDYLVVHGSGDRPPAGGVTIDASHDHRIAMSFLVLGGAARAPITVVGAETIDTSFPGFAGLMNGLGARIAEVVADP